MVGKEGGKKENLYTPAYWGAFVGFPRANPRGSEKHASLENTLVRFKPDTKKCHNIFCQFMTMAN